MAPGDPLAGTYARTAVTGGSDWNLRFDGGAYEMGGSLGFSYVEGDSARILSLQQSSARYFQRPDQDYLQIDSSRTALTGYQGSLYVRKNSGRHWLWNAFFSFESPDFELNDLGRLSTTDDVAGFATVAYRETKPGSLFQSWEVSLSSENLFNTNLDRKFGAIRTDASLTWRNFWRTNLTAWVDVRGQSTTLTRGGPSMKTALSRVVIGSLSNNFGASTSWRARVYYGTNELDGLTYRLSGSLTFRPAPRWEFSISPNYLRDIEPRQYVATLAGAPTATFGQRYVFARINRSTWLARLRVNFAVTPDLTVELYAEPFAASGRYDSHGELAAAGDFALRSYGRDGTTIAQETDNSYTVTDGPDSFTLPFLDFNIRSFRSNMVLRWEWRPGSTLFLVWQQDRSSFEERGDMVRPFSLFDAVTSGGDNFFAVKLTYWLAVN